jgi:glycosyltransferase involved in cell wall biosynthesis
MSADLVSCIMPTADRHQFLPMAIEYFLRQDYPNKELIILDDGKQAAEPIIASSAEIRYIRLPQKGTVGEKRNQACHAALGEIIVHLDDDDWYAPDWITSQVGLLQQTETDICGLSQLYFYSPLAGKAWRYVYPSWDRHKPWVAGATMAYRRSFWEKYP